MSTRSVSVYSRVATGLKHYKKDLHQFESSSTTSLVQFSSKVGPDLSQFKSTFGSVVG